MLKPKSITTVSMRISAINTSSQLKADGPEGLTACRNYPNPFRESTTLQFTLGKNNPLSLSVLDYLGRKLVLENLGYYLPGEH